MIDTRDRARELAARAHANQQYGTQPYMVHLNDVAELLWQFGYYDAAHRDAALLHDILEDTPTTVQDLMAEKMCDIVISVVMFCTDEPGHNRKTRKALTYKRVHALLSLYLKDKDAYAYVPTAIRVKLADRLANIRACVCQGDKGRGLLKMYQREAKDFREALYHPGIADAMWAEYDKLMEA